MFAAILIGLLMVSMFAGLVLTITNDIATKPYLQDRRTVVIATVILTGTFAAFLAIFGLFGFLEGRAL